MRIACLALAAGVLAACQPRQSQTDVETSSAANSTRDDSSVVITVDRDRYGPGASVKMEIRNTTGFTLGFNPCTRTLERLENGTWTAAKEPDRVCTMELWLLEPHATRAATTAIPGTLSAGTYRLSIAFSRQGAVGQPPPPPGTSAIVGVSETFAVAP